ncbi:MAG: type II toxin-antitoxin system VapC family toxin [Rhodospirillaceae bacterium]|nr:type II toxin-antitoxin system VapC family toxin [Rhodospirillaceae bacterium]
MTELVVDASVAIKWVVEESGSTAAIRLFEHKLIAPDLLISECANILWKKVRRGNVTPAGAEIAASALVRANVDLIPTRSLLQMCVTLAMELDHPAYDCIYLALASQRGSRFVTADERLVAAAQRLKSGPTVVLLGSQID